jgi:hypothetical protein
MLCMGDELSFTAVCRRPNAVRVSIHTTSCVRQGEGGCSKTLWRFDEAGYLRFILTARVYEVAVRTRPSSNLLLISVPVTIFSIWM